MGDIDVRIWDLLWELCRCEGVDVEKWGWVGEELVGRFWGVFEVNMVCRVCIVGCIGKYEKDGEGWIG